MNYRKAEIKDLEEINILLKENFGENHALKQIVDNVNKYSFVAVYENKVVGHVYVTKMYNDIKNIYWIKLDYVCVSSLYRNKHIATNLLNNLMEQEKEVKYFELTCNSCRQSARHLYEKLGFTEVDTTLLRK